MLSLRAEYVGDAAVPMKEAGKQYPIVHIGTVDEKGKIEHLGAFCLSDLIGHLTTLAKRQVVQIDTVCIGNNPK